MNGLKREKTKRGNNDLSKSLLCEQRSVESNFFDGNDGSGRPMIYRNPFVPGAEYGYDSTTYEKWKQKGFVQPEVDPWLR